MEIVWLRGSVHFHRRASSQTPLLRCRDGLRVCARSAHLLSGRGRRNTEAFLCICCLTNWVSDSRRVPLWTRHLKNIVQVCSWFVVSTLHPRARSGFFWFLAQACGCFSSKNHPCKWRFAAGCVLVRLTPAEEHSRVSTQLGFCSLASSCHVCFTSSLCRFLSSCSSSCSCIFSVCSTHFYVSVSFYSPHLLCRFELLPASCTWPSERSLISSGYFLATGHFIFAASGLEPPCAIPRHLSVQCHSAQVTKVRQILGRPKQLR